MYRNCRPRVARSERHSSSNNAIVMTFSCSFVAVRTLQKNTAIFPQTSTDRFYLPRRAVRRDEKKIPVNMARVPKTKATTTAGKYGRWGDEDREYILLLVSTLQDICCDGNTSWLHHQDAAKQHLWAIKRMHTHFTDSIKSKAPDPLHYMPNSRHFPKHKTNPNSGLYA